MVKTIGAAALAALLLGATSCSSSDSSSGSDTSASSTTTTAPVDSTTTDDAAPVVETSFSTVQGQPFSEPPILRSEGGVLSTTFDVAPTTFEVAGAQVEGLSYAGEFLGPTLLVEPGDTIEIDLQNRLDEETNFHTHGVHTSPIGISDNVLRVMKPSSDSAIRIKVPRDIAPGTMWSFGCVLDSGIVGAGGIAYFTADDGVHGCELWRSDGTAAGTWLVKDIAKPS